MRKQLIGAAFVCSLLMANPLLAAEDSASDPAYQEALTAWQDNNWELAEERLRAVVDAAPDNYDAYMKLGGIYLTSQRIDDAIDSFQKAIGINSQDSLGFTALSLAYLHKGAYSPARAAAESAQELAPQEEGPRKIMAFIDARLNQGQPRAHP